MGYFYCAPKSTILLLICVVCKINCAGGMKLSLFSTVFLVAWLVGTCFGAVAKKKSSPKKAVVDEEGANKRLKSLEEKIRAGTMVSLTDGNFTKFVIDRPREYGSLLMFTATDPKYQCSVCMKVKNNFDEISKMYNAQYNFSQVPSSQKIAFFRLEVDTARSIFSDLGLETVPRMYYLPPAPSSSLKQNLEDLEVDSRPFMEGIYGALNHINEFAKVEIRILWNPIPILLALGLFSLLCSLFVSTASYDLAKAFLFYQTPKLWVIFSLICFAVGVSGSIYCIIRSAPPFGYNRQGSLSIFAAQGREQFLLEGVIVALWTIGCGVSYYIMFFSSRLRFPIVRHLGVLIGMTLFVVLSLQLWTAYGTKTPWYSLKETLPSDVWQYLRASVKKDSGLVKRFLRLSELWLTEVKDFEALRKKFDLLIVEYVKRLYESSKTA